MISNQSFTLYEYLYLMKYLVLMSDVHGSTSGDFTPFVESEMKRVYDLKDQGVISEIFFRRDKDDAVLILDCIDESSVIEYLGSLPMVKAGLLEYELIGLRDYTPRS